MERVTVRRADLLETVKTNRAEHMALYHQAVEKYREQAIAEINEMLDDAIAGNNFSRTLRLVQPEEHCEDYDTVIAMLEMSIDTDIAVDQVTFRQCVLNQWHWMHSFLANTISYTK